MELEELRSKIELSEVQKAEEKAGKNIELKDQTIISNKDSSAIQSNNKDNSAIQLKDAIINFGSKYIVKLPFKENVGIRIPVKVN